MKEPIILRLELDRVRHQVLHAFTEYTGDLYGMVDEAVRHALSTGEIERQVFEATDRTLREEIAKQVSWAVRQAVWNEDLHRKMLEAMRETLHAATAPEEVD